MNVRRGKSMLIMILNNYIPSLNEAFSIINVLLKRTQFLINLNIYKMKFE